MWKNWSLFEKALLFLIGTLLIAILILAILWKWSDEKLHHCKEQVLCLDKSCIEVSNDILESMDMTVDPCDDFNAYACNCWEQRNPIPEGRTSWSTFMKIHEMNHQIIQQALEKPIETFKSEAERKAKLYYESCLDRNQTIEKLGATPMLKLLTHLGGWSIAQSGLDMKNWTLQKTLQTVQNQYGINGFFGYSIVEDTRNLTRHIIYLDQNGLSLNREYYLDKDHGNILMAYLEYMIEIGVLLGGEPNATRTQMQAVMDFETKLANIWIPNELKKNHIFSIAELQEKADFIEWQLFFQDVMRIVNKKVTSRESIAVQAPAYLEKLTELIADYSSSPNGKIILNNYLIWQTVQSFTKFLSGAFRLAYQDFQTALLGVKYMGASVKRYCVSQTDIALDFAAGAMYVRETFRDDSIIKTEAIINNIRKAFKKNFKNLGWMDEETRKAAEIKADAISSLIGYPDFIKDPKQLDEKYSQLEISRNTYFENNINLSRYRLRKTLGKFNEAVNKTDWNTRTTESNAYYMRSKNQITVPAGILQRPMYDASYPASINYGAIGMILGHEITHGFDEGGKLFDKDGNNYLLWNNQTNEKFKARTSCVSKQYSQFQINGKHLNGNHSLNEDISDNGGLKASYHAYLEFIKTKPEPPPLSLPGLNLTHKQLFFVAFAQAWCSAATKESTNVQLRSDIHSLEKLRIIVSLINLKEFGEVFKCKVGSKMNPEPENKCEVW